MSNYNKGASGERELLSLFYDEGFVGLRAPTSGGCTQRELPDVIVGKHGDIYCFEVKRCGGDYLYLDSEELEELKVFSDAFGAEYYIAVRFDYESSWYFFNEESMHKTEGGQYRVKKEKSNKGETITDII